MPSLSNVQNKTRKGYLKTENASTEYGSFATELCKRLSTMSRTLKTHTLATFRLNARAGES